MSKQKCLLIAYALVLLIVMTMPIPTPEPKCRGDSQYPHDFYSTDHCRTLICKDCGTRKSQEYVDHVFEQIDCYQRQCTRCGLTEEYETHRRLCSTVRQCADCGVTFKKMIEGYHVWEERSADGTVILTCILCGEEKIFASANHNHQWIGENCEEGRRCQVCGLWNSDPAKHSYYTNLAGLITCCKYCSYTEVTVFTADWALVAACLQGNLWLILAFWYAVRNRGTYSLQRNILCGTWLDCSETAPNLRGWRG